MSSQKGYYRSGSCVVAAGNCLYVLGGSYTANAARFDTVENKWEEIASMEIERSYAFGVASRGKIFIAGGGDTCEVYNVCTNEWQSIGSLNTRHAGGSMVCLNGTLYVLGGLNYASETEVTVESYDPTVNKWIVKTSIPVDKNSEEQKCSFKGCALKLSKGVLNKLKNITN